MKQLILDDKSKSSSNQNRQFIINKTLCSSVLRQLVTPSSYNRVY